MAEYYITVKESKTRLFQNITKIFLEKHIKRFKKHKKCYWCNSVFLNKKRFFES